MKRAGSGLERGGCEKKKRRQEKRCGHGATGGPAGFDRKVTWGKRFGTALQSVKKTHTKVGHGQEKKGGPRHS